jgi:hypothetical protein
MSVPTSFRRVRLRHGGTSADPFALAELYRDYPVQQLETIESEWSKARDKAAAVGLVEGLAPLEHAHWDWRNKERTVEAGYHMLVAVEYGGDVQGIMAVLRHPRRARLSERYIVYIDYLEVAPWNLKGKAQPPRFLGVGTVLVAEAMRLSMESNLDGAVGLHSLPQSEKFYERCCMTRLGPDPKYFDLTYFESTSPQAKDLLAALGEMP